MPAWGEAETRACLSSPWGSPLHSFAPATNHNNACYIRVGVPGVSALRGCVCMHAHGGGLQKSGGVRKSEKGDREMWERSWGRGSPQACMLIHTPPTHTHTPWEGRRGFREMSSAAGTSVTPPNLKTTPGPWQRPGEAPGHPSPPCPTFLVWARPASLAPSLPRALSLGSSPVSG